jgi:Icc-related predicted phosphoesterase
LAGLGGSIRYKPTGRNQYTQKEMFLRAMGLVPGLLYNHHSFGRYVDIFITHAPPFHIHDHQDRAHTGLKAFFPILDFFHPHYHLHGHTTIYGGDSKRISQYRKTKIINVNPYQIIEYTPIINNANVPSV